MKPGKIKRIAVGAALLVAGCGGDGSSGSPISNAPGPVVTPTPPPAPAPTTTPAPAPTSNPNFGEVTSNGVTISSGQQAAVVSAGTNNVIDGFDPLTDGFVAQGAAARLQATDPSHLNKSGSAFLVPANYVGAIDPANPTAFQGWTCSTDSFNSGTARKCGDSQVGFVTGTPPQCPSGTTRGSMLINNDMVQQTCNLPKLLSTDLKLPKITGVLYLINADGLAVGSDNVRVTLTIDAGVSIAGSGGLNPYTANLWVARGSKLVVNGTRDNPVSMSGAIRVTMAGSAPINNCQAAASTAVLCQNSTSFVDYSTQYYGGSDANDSSGSIHYLILNLSNFAQLQDPGLRLMGVGSGTVIDHVQMVGRNGPDLAIVGGTVNLSTILINDGAMSTIAIGQGWKGAIQFLLAEQVTDRSLFFASSASENASNDDANPRTNGTIANYTLVKNAGAGASAGLITGGTDFTFANGIIKTSATCLTMSANTAQNGDVPSTVRPAGGTNGVPTTIDEAGPPRFFSNYFACLGR